MPVAAATQEAEAGESLEPRRRRLQWAEIMPLYSSLATEQDSISKKKPKQKTKKTHNFVMKYIIIVSNVITDQDPNTFPVSLVFYF